MSKLEELADSIGMGVSIERAYEVIDDESGEVIFDGGLVAKVQIAAIALVDPERTNEGAAERLRRQLFNALCETLYGEQDSISPGASDFRICRPVKYQLHEAECPLTGDMIGDKPASGE
jgi:hypothetical protein